MLRLAQVLALSIGSGLLIAYSANSTYGLYASERALAAFGQSSDSFSSARSAENDPARFREVLANLDQSLWSNKRKTAFEESLLGHEPVAIGILDIPKLEMRAPVFSGASERNLNLGAGWIEGTALPVQSGNVGIAGHRDGFFRPLKDIAIGDIIILRSTASETRYHVTETLIVDPEDVYVLDPTETDTITLVTCYPFYFVGNAPQRFIVKGAAVPFLSSG